MPQPFLALITPLGGSEPPYPSTGPGFPTNPIAPGGTTPPWGPGMTPQPPVAGWGPGFPTHPAAPGGRPPLGMWGPGFPYPDQGLPGQQPGMDNSLPGGKPPMVWKPMFPVNPIAPGGQPNPPVVWYPEFPSNQPSPGGEQPEIGQGLPQQPQGFILIWHPVYGGVLISASQPDQGLPPTEGEPKGY
jgi:hypothetical protein